MGRRTTITLDDDVARKLAEEARKTGEPFKVVVNEAIRRGMLRLVKPKDEKPFKVKAWKLGLPSGVNFRHLDADLEDEYILEKMRRSDEEERERRKGR
jgi:predicted transcriptional regulator